MKLNNGKISIVTAYFNRKKLFIRTLESIARSKVKDFEFIVVDDCSNEDERVEDLVVDFPFLKMIRLEKKDKWYINPCVPFNIGIKEAKNDIIVLQNPECIHVGDILSFVTNNLINNLYLSFAMYYLPKEFTENLELYPNLDFLSKYFPINGWQNHPKYKPTYYHFCSAITRSDMNRLGGFDERYAYGIAIDDCDFATRIMRAGIGMLVISDVFVAHQYHESVFNIPNYKKLFERNVKLYHKLNKEKK
jgi:GT2 family glycosyltransferase